MKNTILFISIVISTIILDGCHKGPCDGVVFYYPIYPELTHYIYNQGSYWVYRDSATGNTDSMYVYAHQYQIHAQGEDYIISTCHDVSCQFDCGPTYNDIDNMQIQHFHNGTLKDTIKYVSEGTDASSTTGLYISGTPRQSNLPHSVFISLYWQTPGYLKWCSYIWQNGTVYDSVNCWFNGIEPVVISGTYTFNNVRSWGVQINDGTCPVFTYHTDIYFTSATGIIKMVQHQPTGDVTWSLINYHIVN